MGQILLPVTFGTCNNFRPELIDFDIAPIYPALAQFMAATHPTYNLMKMPGSSGVLTVAGDTKDTLLVLKLALKTTAAAQPVSTDTSKAKGAAPTKKKQLFTQDKAETKQVSVDEDGSTGATFTIGTNLEPEQEEALVRFLRANKKVFAWEPDQLAGVPRDVIEHHLNVCPMCAP